MTIRDALRLPIETGEFVCLSYLNDLTDEQLFLRPTPGANHIHWQLGHLICSENRHLHLACPDRVALLPEAMTSLYAKDRAGRDEPGEFMPREQLMQQFRQQRSATLSALAEIDEKEFDRETGLAYAPTVAAIFALQGTHWLMHSGQWAIVRRQLGRPPLF